MKNILATILFVIITTSCFAQKDSLDDNKFQSPGWFTGGNVTFGLGGYNNRFVAGLNPHFGYTLSKWSDAGVVVNFQYQSSKDFYGNKYRYKTYGLGAFTRLYPVRFLFVQVQPEYNFTALKFIPFNGTTTKDNVSDPSLLLGVGYAGSRSSYSNTFSYISILFDVLEKTNSPYVDGNGKLIPVVRAGFNIGIRKKQPRTFD
ncbi:MAG: hypothetical protein ABIR81_08040 [Ginsengibacter sp.]